MTLSFWKRLWFAFLSRICQVRPCATWLWSLRLCCLTSSKLPIFRCCCLGLVVGVWLLSRYMLVEVELPCASLGDHLKTLMNTWGWLGVTLVVHFDADGWLSLETYLLRPFLGWSMQWRRWALVGLFALLFIVFNELLRSTLGTSHSALERGWV